MTIKEFERETVALTPVLKTPIIRKGWEIYHTNGEAEELFTLVPQLFDRDEWWSKNKLVDEWKTF